MRNAGVPVEFQTSGTATALPKGLELSVYRIVQEALTNVIKHARSAHTWVRLHYGEERLVLCITNAALGAGVDARSADDSGPESSDRDRHGIIGMTERAAAFGGTLTAGPLPDGTFEVRACIPLPGAS